MNLQSSGGVEGFRLTFLKELGKVHRGSDFLHRQTSNQHADKKRGPTYGTSILSRTQGLRIVSRHESSQLT